MKRIRQPEAIAGEVCSALRSAGVEAVLVGGAVVSIYSNNRYMSYDLDFVVRGTDSAITRAMASIGFEKGSGRHFERKNTRYIVEFLESPAGIGRAIIHDFAVRRTQKGLLKLYKPTHCVMDRLAAFYHWRDMQGLAQAIMVALRHRIRQSEIRKWSEGEGMIERYEEYLRELGKARIARHRSQGRRQG